MALTVSDCERIIQHELGGAPAPELSYLDIINECGEYLCTGHGWKWLERQETTLSTVASQNFITLPTDFNTVIDLRPTNSLTRSFRWVTLSQLNLLRTATINVTTYNWYGAIMHPEQTGGAQPGPPIVGLWPTPNANETGAFTLIYQARWDQRTADQGAEGFIKVPQWFEPVFIECLRAFARGRDASEALPLRDQLVAFEASPQYLRARVHNGRIQPELGEMRGGAVQESETRIIQFWDGTTSAPS